MSPLITRTHWARLRAFSSRLSKATHRNNSTRPPSPTLLSHLVSPLLAYQRAAQTRPYIVQVSTSLFIWCTADVLAQSIEQSSQPISSSWDIPRTLRAFVIGGIAAIPTWHWFNLMARSFTSLPRWAGLAARVATHQAVFAPVFNTYFFFSQAVLSGATVTEGVERVRTALPTSLLNSVRVWPPIMVINFAFVPREVWSVIPGFVAVGWQCYLSFLNQRTAKLLEDRKQEVQV
ncbi:hypothetical protein C8R45DRAFT_968179 [Mycena sanguinolenta]|nr:hypothetical protein C8R45DRAFT_968179 [Mycena sanguinolenta]